MFALYKEFKEFAVKGNMIDIAIGVIIGAAFNKVVSVIVSEIFMPPLNLLTNGIDFTDFKLVLRAPIISDEGVILAEEVAIGYGIVFNAFIDFTIIAITVFIVIKGMNRLRSKADDVANDQVTTPKDIELLNKISNLIEAQNTLLQEQNKPYK